MRRTSPARVFSVEGLLAPRWRPVVRPALDALLGLAKLERLYAERPAGLDAAGFVDWTLDTLGVDVHCTEADRGQVPAEGPVVVVANHPFGGIEGLALAQMLLRQRTDVRIVANRWLAAIPELRELFLFVDAFGSSEAPRRNFGPTRSTLRWLDRGGLLAVFPAGTVAHYRAGSKRVEDPPWNAAVVAWVERTRCPVLPVHVCGRNGVGFQLAGLVHSSLRTAWLARAMLARRGKCVELRVGRPVPYSRLEGLAGPVERIAYLRGRSEILADRPPFAEQAVQPRITPGRCEPIVAGVDPALLEQEIAALPRESLLVETEDEVVHVAAAENIPRVLHEIGRLRERTFREVGEGTGRALDLDRFDPHYLHLFVWHRKDRALVGAYRLGLTDRLLAQDGIGALYTATLFRYRRRLFESMGPAIEMGRSWVRSEYQKSYQGLMLLWKGIGQFAVRHPRHATLFGPVSISAEYRSASQRLLVAFLEQNRYVHEWSAWVKPRTPHRPATGAERRTRLLALSDLDEVSAYIAEIEADHKGVPILLRQYLKLGGRLLGFNVDPAFSNVLDVLILVDLRRTEPRILARYMGREGAASFLGHHRALGIRAS